MSFARIESDRLHRYLSELEKNEYCYYCGEPIADDQISVDYKFDHYHDTCAIKAGVITEGEVSDAD